MDFLGEAGQDGGGLRREFWSVLGKDIKNSLFEGSGDRLTPRHDITALQVCYNYGYNFYIILFLLVMLGEEVCTRGQLSSNGITARGKWNSISCPPSVSISVWHECRECTD